MRFDRIVSTIDAHAAGEPLRIFTAGVPPLPGATILDRRRLMAAEHDDLRRALLFEPRGHADMYGAILTPPVSAEAAYGVIFLTNEGYSTMCGHGVIALTTALIETGTLARDPAAAETTVAYDSPAGLIRATASITGDRVTAVAFRNVPAFRLASGVSVETSVGRVTADVAFGGAWYALVEASDLGLPVVPERVADLTRLGMEVKRAVAAKLGPAIVHPLEPELHGLYGTIISAPPSGAGGDGRNVTVYAAGAVDRSPCGTGTSAKLANLFAAGRIGVGVPYVHESIIGSRFTATIVEQTRLGDQPAIVTEIVGRGFVTGLHQFFLDAADPTTPGFLVR